MRGETAACLSDIDRACHTIRVAVSAHDAETYADDPVIQAAVERLFTTIGEALMRIRALEPPIVDRVTDANKIIGFRNILVHGYDRVDPILVWRAATESL